MPRLNKTLEYRRARFLDDGHDLEELARQAWGTFPTQAQRVVTFSDGRATCGLRSRDAIGGGLLVHCARFTDGQGVGTIPTAPAPEVGVGERPPAPGENFLNSDLMALMRGNHVISMNSGRNAGSLRIYFQQLFRMAGFADATRQFEIVRVGSPNALAIIDSVGVKSVDLDVEIAEATSVDLLDDETGGLWRDIKRNIGGAFSAITARDETVEQLRTAERGAVKVSINVPKNDLEVAKNGLDSLAEEIVEDEEADAFVIHLRNGATIKPQEVAVRKQVKLDSAANSVSVFQAWEAMELYLGELEESGQLES